MRQGDGNRLFTPVILPDDAGLIVTSVLGAILRAKPDGTEWIEVRQGEGNTLFTPVILPDDAGLIATSPSGAILRAKPDGTEWVEVRQGDGNWLNTPVILHDDAGLIVTSSSGAILRVSNRFSDNLSMLAADLPEFEAGDAALWDHLNAMPVEVKTQPAVEAIFNAVATVTDQRKQVVATIKDAEAQRDALQEAEQDQRTPIQRLADNAPPAILLLFLLATLSALYRYNIRLAGFHDARADALVLAVSDQHVDMRKLGNFVDALAADKVEFGRTNTPADQATEIAKSVISRVNP